MKVPFNIPYITGKESLYVKNTIDLEDPRVSENYVNKCKNLLETKWNFKKVFLTNSCTAALEVCALLIDIKKGDEVILPSYTYTSTANAFLRQGATLIFADSRNDFPGIDEKGIESLISEKTRAIVPVHYAGVACNMGKIMDIAEKYKLYVIEDAALAFDAFYKSKSLGAIGHLGCLSFHKSKNLQCIEGGALVINDNTFTNKVLSILEKGTNRNEFIEGKVDRYEWVDLGSSYLMTELHASYLYAQLEQSDWIREKRKRLWSVYFKSLKILGEKGFLKLPYIPDYADHNAHTFYLISKNKQIMADLKMFLNENDIKATVHYTALDQSIFWKRDHSRDSKNVNSLVYNDCLLRLPLYNSMSEEETQFVIATVLKFFQI